MSLRADGTTGDAAFRRVEQELDLAELDLAELDLAQLLQPGEPAR